MPKKKIKKEARTVNIQMEKRIYDRLELFCDETGSSKTKAIEKILDQYFDAYFKRTEDEKLF